MSNLIRRILLVRHATPLFDREYDYFSLPGPPLSEIGNKEAKLLAMKLGRIPTETKIYSSPMLRAVQTAQHISMVKKYDIETNRYLNEIDMKNISHQALSSHIFFIFNKIPVSKCSIWVTHGAIISAAIWYIANHKNVCLTKYGNVCPPAAIWNLEYFDDGQWKAKYLFSTSSGSFDSF